MIYSRHEHNPVEITRDCKATLIPSGDPIVLQAGVTVTVTQALGGSITVQTDLGQLARISGEDAVDLGLGHLLAPAAESDADGADPDAPCDADQVIERLKTVFDPEIPVNVVDLGLIYGCEVIDLPDGGHRVEIKMSMTAPGCGMGDVLRDDAHQRVAEMPGVTEVDVELVWDPPWDLSRLSDAARLELGMV
jgi:probable FeS assembly SUF system protein SufT